MNNRKIAALFLALALLFPQKAAAAESCTIAAASCSTLSGKNITVDITVAGNPGFTNFGIALEYDRNALELLEIQIQQEEKTYLCGSHVSHNTNWLDAQKNARGYVAAASTETVSEDGVLFSATFRVNSEFAGQSVITPHVYYMRNYDGTTGFTAVDTVVQPATITTIAMGDINKDGVIEYDDVIAAYRAFTGEFSLSEEQLEIANMDGEGQISWDDVTEIYQIYTGGE